MFSIEMKCKCASTSGLYVRNYPTYQKLQVHPAFGSKVLVPLANPQNHYKTGVKESVFYWNEVQVRIKIRALRAELP